MQVLGSHRKGYLFTQHRMESGGYRKGFPTEVISKLGTKRQVRICPAKAGGGLSRMTAGAKAHRLSCWFTRASTGGGKRDVGRVDLDL